jgi:hypothetical protein
LRCVRLIGIGFGVNCCVRQAVRIKCNFIRWSPGSQNKIPLKLLRQCHEV